MAEAKEGTETGKEEGAAAAAPEAPPKTVFQDLREKLDAGERIFPDAVAEEAGDAAEEPSKGEEAASKEGGEEGKGSGEGEDAGAVGEEEEPGKEAVGEGEADAGDGGEGETVTIELSGRNDGETVEIEIDSADTDVIEALRRTRNEGLRREELNKGMDSLQAERDEFNEIVAELDANPAAFVVAQVAEDHQSEVAVQIVLNNPAALAKVQEILEVADDAQAMELLRLKGKTEREEAIRTVREKVKTTVASQRALAAGKIEVKRIFEDISSLPPKDMDKADASKFVNAAMRVAGDIAGETGKYVSRAELIDALDKEGLLKTWGIPAGAAPSKEAGTQAASKTADADKAAAGKGDAQAATGLKKARVRRRNIAGSAGAGAGAPGASIELPPSTSVKDRIAYVRKHGLGSVLAGK